jgi:hypothetical protein
MVGPRQAATASGRRWAVVRGRAPGSGREASVPLSLAGQAPYPVDVTRGRSGDGARGPRTADRRPVREPRPARTLQAGRMNTR